MKNTGTALILWIVGFFGMLGLHRFYMGKIGTGILWFCTCGLGGIGAFIDLFTLGTQIQAVNAQYELAHLRTASIAAAQLSQANAAQIAALNNLSRK